MTPDLLPDRMANKVQISADGCWLWTGARQSLGYAQTSVGGRMVYAHRRAYELLVGPIPKGLEMDHLCRVRNCINPEHLEPVTHSENMRRAAPFMDGMHAPRIYERLSDFCQRGHAVTPENLRKSSDGRRRCRQCHREASRRRKPAGT